MLELSDNEMQPQNEAFDADTSADRLVPQSNKLADRRQQLHDDLAYFETKLEDIKQLDPLDFTGLVQTYSEHATQIRRLVEEFEGGVTDQ